MACTLCSVGSLFRISTRLAHLRAEHVRHVVAALLVEQNRRGWNREPEVAEAVLHVYKDILECAAVADEDVLVRDGHARLHAVRVRVHSQDVGLRRGALECDPSRHVSGCCRVHRTDGWRRCRGRSTLRRSPTACRGAGGQRRNNQAHTKQSGHAPGLQTFDYHTPPPPASATFRRTRSCIHFGSHHSTGFTGWPFTSIVKCR